VSARASRKSKIGKDHRGDEPDDQNHCEDFDQGESGA